MEVLYVPKSRLMRLMASTWSWFWFGEVCPSLVVIEKIGVDRFFEELIYPMRL